jgi:hypothetical protein
MEYDSRDFEEEQTIFSTFTYQTDLTRIAGTMYGVLKLKESDLEGTVTNSDAMIVNWKLHLSKESRGN